MHSTVKRRLRRFCCAIAVIAFCLGPLTASAIAEIIIDNGGPGTTYTGGAWGYSSGANPYNGSSRAESINGATYTFQGAVTGNQTVSLWWTYWSSRCSSVPVDIYNGTQLLATVSVNQSQISLAGQWNVLGTYSFTGTARVVIKARSGCSACADAVQFTPSEAPALTYIVITGAVSVNENSSFDYTAIAYYEDGSSREVQPDIWIENSAYAEISLTGLLTTGEVSSDEPCLISAEYTENGITRLDDFEITVEDSVAPAEVIIDNDGPGTSYTGGAWGYSSGANPYNGSSRAESLSGATYSFQGAVAGDQTVSLWWTYWSSRCNSAPVDIYNGTQLLGTVSVNQSQLSLAGQWNVLGTYSFTGTARVVIKARSGCSTCADAVRFQPISANTSPIAYIESVSPSPADLGQPVEFIGYGTDAEGPIEAYRWESSINGFLSDLSSFTTSSLAEGTHSISFKVQDGDGIWSEAVYEALVVGTIPSTIIIDNHDQETSYTGTWSISGAENPYYPNDPDADSLWSRNGSTYTWHFTSPQSAVYELSQWWTQWSSRSTGVPVAIQHANGVSTVYTNQQINGGRWNVLGMFYFEANMTYAITVTAQPYPTSTCADAMRFQVVSSDPFVEIVEPSSYHLQTSPNFTARAIAYGLDPTWKIRFVLDLGTPDELNILDTSEPYEGPFVGVAEGEHTVHAIVVDTSDIPVPGAYALDLITQIGVGKYYVSIGDSITFGFGDDDPTDNTSLDGRNSGGGYEPILNDLLTGLTGVPHTIVNEGVEGATSSYGRSAILTTLSAHPESQRFLIQWGTNDARPWLPVPSGLGLTSSDAGYPGTFKDNMQRIVAAINAAGKEPCLAKPPITLGDSTYSTPYPDPDEGARSLLIKEYNEVIDELVNDPLNEMLVSPADFYSLFNEDVPGGKRYDFEYTDNLHPNGKGYRSMANKWLESLTP